MDPTMSQTWLVTGASRGLGRELASQLAARGDRVLAIARNADALHALAATHPTLVPVRLDLADTDAIGPALRAVLRGVDDLAGAINNAGIGWYKPFLEHDESELRRLLQVNLLAPMQVCRAVLPALLAQGHGHIVNIGSDLGRRPLANMAPYVASKHGLAGFSHSLLREVKGRGVRVSLVQPGLIDTGFGGGEEGGGDGVGSLAVAALARLVLQLIDAPPGLVVDELTVHPLGQADF
jgi:short-subunit dehydrogenase